MTMFDRSDVGAEQRVEIEARVRTPRNFNNPGSFDYAGVFGAAEDLLDCQHDAGVCGAGAAGAVRAAADGDDFCAAGGGAGSYRVRLYMRTNTRPG